MGLYVESADRPYTSRHVNEDLFVGTLAAENGSDLWRRAEATDNRIEYLATKPRQGAWIAFDEDDTLTDFKYTTDDDEPAGCLPLADGDVVKVRTPQNNGTDPAANISDGDVIGIAGVGGVEFEGRVVESGYTDNASTVYSESGAGDFLKLGKALKDDASSFDDIVRVRVNRENLQ